MDELRSLLLNGAQVRPKSIVLLLKKKESRYWDSLLGRLDQKRVRTPACLWTLSLSLSLSLSLIARRIQTRGSTRWMIPQKVL
jgi:hypothetical protein